MFRDPTCYTSLAFHLDVAMSIDDAARARYRAIYGVEWEPLYTDDALGLEIDDAIESMTVATVAGKGPRHG